MTTYGYDFSWTSDSGETRITGQGFPTVEERDEAFRKALDAFGYRAPRWWEYWRWGEHQPGPHDRYAARNLLTE